MYEHNNEKLQALNSIMDEWAAQFENKPAPFMDFNITFNGMLTVNGTVLAPIDEVCIEAVEHDVEFLDIPLRDGSSLEIGILWEYDEDAPTAPEIGYINAVRPLYRCS